MSNLLVPLDLLLLAWALLPGQPNRWQWVVRLLLLLVLSPLLGYVDAVFGFAVRLRLSRWAGALLTMGGVPVQVEGNVLTMNGYEMAVDPACMGLHMTGLTVLLAAFWLMAYERRYHRALAIRWGLLYGSITLLLTGLSNLSRISLLVLFGLGPDHLLHEGMGLLCVLVYAWLPLGYLARRLVSRFGLVPVVGRVASKRQMHWSGAGLIGLAGLSIAVVRPTEHVYDAQVRPGYARQMTRFGFMQYNRPGELIYVKPLPDWYSAEHSPIICWQAKGYTLRRVREQSLAGQLVYVGELKKGIQTLYTAWWFTNGQYRSTGQVDVRTRMLRGEPGFALVNVTAAEIGTLTSLVRSWH